MIKDEVTIEIKGHSYPVKFPTVGQFYQFEAMSPSVQAQHALDMIDIEAAIVVLCPKLIEDLKVKNFSELDVRDYKLIRDEYFKTVAPFFKEITELLKGEESDDVKKEE